MVGGLPGAIDAFGLRIKGAGNALEGLADALGLGPEFDALKRAVGPTVDSILNLAGSIGQVIEKSGAIKLAGEIGAKAFDLIREAVTFLDRIVRQNIGPLSEFVKGFGNTLKAAFDGALAVFKALEGPIEAVVKAIAPFAGLLGDVAGALVIYKAAASGAEVVTGLLGKTGGSTLLTLGKIAIVLAPAIGAFEVAKATVPGFTTTLDQLGFMATHVGDTIRELTKQTNGVANPFLKMGAAVHDTTGKFIGYAKAFETLPQAQERLNNLTKQGLNMFTNTSNFIDANFRAIEKGTSFVYTLAYKARDLLTGQMSDLATYKGTFQQYLLTHQEAAQVIQSRTIPALEAEKAKMAELQNKVDGATRAIDGLSKANDELNKKLNEANQGISAMDGAVHQLALKHSEAKIAFHDSSAAIQDQTLSVDEAFSKWKDLTQIQKAGGEGAYAAGVAAGKLKDGLVDATKGGITPMLDATYKFIGTTQDATKGIADNTIATQKAKEEGEKAAGQLKDQADKTAELTRITSTHGTVLTDASGKVAGGFWGSQKAIDSANKVLGIWNSTPFTSKTTDTSTIAAVKALMEGAVAALRAWNALPMANKSATATTVNVTTGGSIGIGGGAKPAPSPVRGPSPLSTSMGLGEFGGGRGAGSFGALAQAAQQATQTAFSLTGLQSQIDAIVKMFNSLDAKALKAASDQAESVGKIAGAASSMVDAFGKMQNYTSVSKEIMAKVTDDTVVFTKMYIAGASQFNVKALEGAATYIDTTGKVAGAASSMADALKKLKDWQGPINASIEGFAYNAKVLNGQLLQRFPRI
jgi:hypothetical protein